MVCYLLMLRLLSGIFFVDVIIINNWRNKKYSSNLTLESCDQFYPLEALLKIDDQSVCLINSPRLISIFEASNGHGLLIAEHNW